MQFQGQIKTILPARQGVSQRTGNPWQRLPFLFEFREEGDQFAQRMNLETSDDAAIAYLREGMEIAVEIKFDTHTWGQNTYNDINVRNIMSAQKQKAIADATANGGEVAEGADNPDNLPF